MRFRLSFPISPLPNRESWEQFLAEFTANDPTVGYVELITGFGVSNEETPPDCLYQSFTPLSSLNPAEPVFLNLNPFVDADPAFDEADFIGNTLEQLKQDNQLWGLPVAVMPSVLRYDPQAFAEAGLSEPVTGWTIDTFAQALPMLGSMTEDGMLVFRPLGGATYLYMLIGAYGGQILDNSTNPPTINITDPTTLAAIRQVLDLAREGYIDYNGLDSFGGGFSGGPGMESPILSESLSPFNFRLQLQLDGANVDDNTRLTTYPVGATYTPVAFGMGSLFIDAQTLHPEACYRLLSAISQRADLFYAMPARRSIIDLPELEASQGSNLVETYRNLAAMMDSPNAIYVPGEFGLSYDCSFIELRWLNDVFDGYMLEGGDLETLAAEAEQNIALYRECRENVPDYDPSMTDAESREIFLQDSQCAISIDPETAQFFPNFDQ